MHLLRDYQAERAGGRVDGVMAGGGKVGLHYTRPCRWTDLDQVERKTICGSSGTPQPPD